MKKIVLFFCTCILLLADNAIMPKEYQHRLKIGIDVNWAMFNWEIKNFSLAEVQKFKKVEFSHIRIRFKNNFEKFHLSKEEYLQYLDKVIKYTLKAGLIPIIAFAAEDFKKNPSDKNLYKVVRFWKELAQRYKNYTHLLAFDIMIEPAKKIKKRPKILNKLYELTVNAIRVSNPKRIIFIAPPKIARPSSLKILKISSKSDGFLMVETHFYAVGPSKINKKRLWIDGSKDEKKLIKNQIKTILDWEKNEGILVWIGAIMPGNYNHGDNYSIKEQIKFANFISCEFKKAHIPFAINADHKFYDVKKQEWRKDRFKVLKTILNPVCGK